MGDRKGHNQLSEPIWVRKGILRKTWPFELSLKDNMGAHWDTGESRAHKGRSRRKGTEAGWAPGWCLDFEVKFTVASQKCTGKGEDRLACF